VTGADSDRWCTTTVRTPRSKGVARFDSETGRIGERCAVNRYQRFDGRV